MIAHPPAVRRSNGPVPCVSECAVAACRRLSSGDDATGVVGAAYRVGWLAGQAVTVYGGVGE